MQRALPELLALRHDTGWLLDWRRRMCDELSSAGYDVVQPDATMFIYVGTPDPYDDMDPSPRSRRRACSPRRHRCSTIGDTSASP